MRNVKSLVKYHLQQYFKTNKFVMPFAALPDSPCAKPQKILFQPCAVSFRFMCCGKYPRNCGTGFAESCKWR